MNRTFSGWRRALREALGLFLLAILLSTAAKYLGGCSTLEHEAKGLNAALQMHTNPHIPWRK